MKPIVIYKSKTGFTEKYGQWIAEELRCKSLPLKKAKQENLQDYNLIIYGGGIYAGIIVGLKEMKKLLSALPNKNLVVYCTGATPLEMTEKIAEVKKVNLKDYERSNIPFYYFLSGLNYERMGFFSRRIMKLMSSQLEKELNQSGTENSKVPEKSFDLSDRKYIEPLVRYVKWLTHHSHISYIIYTSIIIHVTRIYEIC